MLSSVHILIAGGDPRQLGAIEGLSNAGATVYLAAFDQLEKEFERVTKVDLADVDFSILDAILLPVYGLKENGRVESAFSEQDLFLTKDLIAKTPSHCVIYSGVWTDYLKETVAATNRKMVEIYALDEVSILNSIPTVEGALMLAIQHTPSTIHGSNVVIIGFGRVGQTAARMFSAIGAKVKVGARKRTDLARIQEMGLQGFHTNDLAEAVIDADLCLNTVPHLLITSQVIDSLPDHSFILDISSQQGGTDFAYAKEKGIKTMWAHGLPGKTAPKTGGKILADVLTRLMVEEKNTRS